MDYQQQRRATPEERARFEARMAKRNRQAGSPTRKYLAYIIASAAVVAVIIPLVAAISGA